jgi:heat shock protein HspQ
VIQRATPPPRFAPGDLVRHVRYGYRGVVVALDPVCRASEAWYRSNRTQPAREQPWYHVLVDGASHSTYAAQTSLDADPEPRPVEHPLVAAFFDGFAAGRHVRNGEPWPDLLP